MPADLPSLPPSVRVTPDSFHTVASTTTSSPTPHQPSSSSSSSPPAPAYRVARQLPRELKEHCQIYLEEQIYGPAISFLNSILFSGNSRRNSPRSFAYVPPPSHLALLATLCVHPLHTTRAEGPDRLQVATRALDYLRNIIAIVGPVNANLATAFRFRSRDDIRRYRSGRSYSNEHSQDVELHSEDQMRGLLANESSLWARADDFWSVVGWAFNCCTVHPHRWRYWRVWLELMVDVMDADWEERLRLDVDAHGETPGPGRSGSLLRESIIASFISEDSRRRGVQRVVKALLADGRKQSMAMFREVFDREPRSAKKRDLKRKREPVDLANDKFGDYCDEDCLSSGESDPPTPSANNVPRQRPMTGPEIESVALRLQFFRLASRTYHELYDPSLTSTLYEMFSSSMRSVPLQQFSLLISVHRTPLIQESTVTLLSRLIQDLLPAPRAGTDPARVDPETYAAGGLSTDMLERCYLPFATASSSATDDARVSLVLENMLLLMSSINQLVGPCTSLAAALDAGIKARSVKAQAQTGRKATRGAAGSPEAAVAESVLEASAARMRALVGVLAAS